MLRFIQAVGAVCMCLLRDDGRGMFALLLCGLAQALQLLAQQRVLIAQTLDFNIFDVEELKGG